MRRIDDSYGGDRDFRRSPELSSFLVRRSGLIAVIVIVVIGGIALYSQGFIRVPAGYRGVLMTWGKVEDKILQEGLNFVIPFVQTVEMMNVQVQKAEST
ncbi:MAG: SPFH domain-containing protein, partial [Candidatus Bathyarchaeota archaeon]